MPCPRIKLSNSQILIWDGVETELLRTVFAHYLSRKNADVPDLYFTLPDAVGFSPTPFLNQNGKHKEEESWVSFQNLNGWKLQNLYTQGGVAYGSPRNLDKASNLPVTKMKQTLLSKHSPTKIQSCQT